jgi:hypothetical protein
MKTLMIMLNNKETQPRKQKSFKVGKSMVPEQKIHSGSCPNEKRKSRRNHCSEMNDIGYSRTYPFWRRSHSHDKHPANRKPNKHSR